jgi:uncharacterized protein (TIGR00251 family)
MIKLELHPRGIVLPVRAHAGARQNAILGERQESLRVAVSAAPEKGKANRAIIDLVSKKLGLPKSAIELISGDTSAQKRFLIVGEREESIRRALATIVAK